MIGMLLAHIYMHGEERSSSIDVCGMHAACAARRGQGRGADCRLTENPFPHIRRGGVRIKRGSAPPPPRPPQPALRASMVIATYTKALWVHGSCSAIIMLRRLLA